MSKVTYSRDGWGNMITASHWISNDIPGRIHGTAFQIRQTITEGRVNRVDYLDSSGDPVRTIRGYASLSFDYDFGNLLDSSAVWFLDESSGVCEECAGISMLYHDGNLIEEQFIDATGRTYKTRISEWKNHRETRRMYYGPDRSPIDQFLGASGWSASYDEDGHKTSFRFGSGRRRNNHAERRVWMELRVFERRVSDSLPHGRRLWQINRRPE